MSDQAELVEMTAEIVSAYVSNSSIPMADLPALISQIHKTLTDVATGAQALALAAPLAPAVPIKKSVTPEYLICLEDGRRFKSLKRHLRTKYDMTPDEYRAKWGLPKDYPMVAPSYAAARSNLAKQMGLGQGVRKIAAEPAAAAKPTRGRPRAKVANE